MSSPCESITRKVRDCLAGNGTGFDFVSYQIHWPFRFFCNSCTKLWPTRGRLWSYNRPADLENPRLRPITSPFTTRGWICNRRCRTTSVVYVGNGNRFRFWASGMANRTGNGTREINPGLDQRYRQAMNNLQVVELDICI